MRNGTLALLLLTTSSLGIVFAAPKPIKHPLDGLLRQSRWVMGTRLEIAIAVPGGKNGPALLSKAFDIAGRIDALLSNYKKDSPLSRFNRLAGKPPAPVTPAFYRYLQRSVDASRKSGGAFDITVGPLLKLYRRPPVKRRQQMLAKRLVSSSLIKLLPGFRAGLSRPGMSLDPGGNGKGVAVDRIVEFLKKSGVKRAFVNFGGSSFYGLGPKPWRILLSSGGEPQVFKILLLKNAALSTSQSYQKLAGGKRRFHIVDPRSGELIREARYSAAVSPSATDAEVLSTSLIVSPTSFSLLKKGFVGSQLMIMREKHPGRIDLELKKSLRPVKL